MSCALSLRTVSKSFEGICAVDGVSLDLEVGEIHGLIGPNGAGKTTIVNIAAGEIRPDIGTVVLGDKDVTRLLPYKRARLGLARVYQHPRLFGEMSVFENVVVALERKRIRGRAARRAAIRLLEQLDMAESRHIPVFRMPYGRRKLLEVARATAIESTVLLLDEPASGLAADEIQVMLELIETSRQGRGVLLIEHDVDLVMSACDRISVVESGRWLVTGTPEEVQRNSEVTRAYLGVN